MRTVNISLLFVMVSSMMAAQSLMGDINQERDPAKRSELALSLADEAFDHARELLPARRSGEGRRGARKHDDRAGRLRPVPCNQQQGEVLQEG